MNATTTNVGTWTAYNAGRSRRRPRPHGTVTVSAGCAAIS